MLALLETPAGFALFKIKKAKQLSKVDDVFEYFQNPKAANKLVKLKAFHKFEDSAEALKATAKIIDGKLPKDLKKFLKNNIISKEIQETLICSEKKLGNSITKKLGIKCSSGEKTLEIFRGIRYQLSSLLKGINESDFKTMSLGLSHSLSRYRLKFSPEKVDVMIIQGISLLDDLDKELNNYSMRLKEWYSWHFPELADILTDNFVYAKMVALIGMKENVKDTQESQAKEIVPLEIWQEIKDAVHISMGSEILEKDEVNVKGLANQIVEISQYREALSEYIKNRMMAIAPNLTNMVGEVVGARLVAKAGSLMNLAKLPSSTVQILGAEKALFKAMRTKHATPKYGLIYYASVIGQTPPKLKGKISRSVAAKCSLCIRYDALGESVDGKFGNMNRQYIENKIKQLNSGVDISNNKYKYKMPKWEPKTDVKSFNVEEDFPETVKEKEEAKPAKPAKKRKASKEKAEKTKKKEKKKRKKPEESEESEEEIEKESASESSSEEGEQPAKKKKKKLKKPLTKK